MMSLKTIPVIGATCAEVGKMQQWKGTLLLYDTVQQAQPQLLLCP